MGWSPLLELAKVEYEAKCMAVLARWGLRLARKDMSDAILRGRLSHAQADRIMWTIAEVAGQQRGGDGAAPEDGVITISMEMPGSLTEVSYLLALWLLTACPELNLSWCFRRPWPQLGGGLPSPTL